MKQAIEFKEVLDAMWLYNQTYSIASAADNTQKQAPKWYVMDEFGCAMEHSPDPNFACMPFFFVNKGRAYNLIWPIKDVKEGDRITRNFIPRKMSNESKENHEFRSLMVTGHRKSLTASNEEDLPRESKFDTSPVGVERVSTSKRTLYCDYISTEELKQCPDLGFTVVDRMQDADVLLLSRPTPLDKLKSGAFVNHFHGEESFYMKDQLAAFIQGSIGYPAWYPRTFVLHRDLQKLVENMTQGNGYWVVRQADSSMVEFEPVVTRDELRVCRLVEVGTVVASECEYSLLCNK